MHNQGIEYDTIIVGSGIAGLNLARKLIDAGQKVFVASKEAITEGASKYSQGGVAVVKPDSSADSIEQHIQDTLDSGQGLCDPQVVELFVANAWSELQELFDLGLELDSDLNQEGAHSARRIWHKDDATGRAILKPLLDYVSRKELASLYQGCEAVSLIKDSSSTRVCGVRFSDIAGNEFDVLAKQVVLACGGYAALYQDFTCPEILCGDAIALASDAGARVENLEFVQFHPTVMKTKEGNNFMISETLRGAGAKLKNIKLEDFAVNYHQQAELASRDVLCRAIYQEMRKNECEHVYLDARHIDQETLVNKFPNIYSFCLAQGFDLTNDLLPVRPAAHYGIGGIKVDHTGQSSVEGLYAIGECASTGLHGANRLASNSLMECIVAPRFVAANILEQSNHELPNLNSLEYCSQYFLPVDYKAKLEHDKLLQDIRMVMTKNLAMERRQKSIQSCIKFLESLTNCKEKTTAILIAKSALLRKESRGAHFRFDAPRSQKAFCRATILGSRLQVQRITDKAECAV